MRLRTQLFLVTALVSMLVMVVVLALVTARWQRALERGARQRGRAQVTMLAQICAEPAMVGNYSELQRIADALAREPDVVYVAILDRDGEVAVSSQERPGHPFFTVDSAAPDPAGLLERAQQELVDGKATLSGRPVMDFAAPLVVYRRSWGVARIGLDLRPIDEEIHSMRRMMFGLGLAGLALGALLAALFSAGVTRPLATLAAAAEELSKRRRNVRVGLRGAREVVRLGAAFNEMAGRVQEHVEQTEEKTEEIDAGYRILARIAANEDREALIESILEVVHELTGAARSTLLARDERGEGVDRFSLEGTSFEGTLLSAEDLGLDQALDDPGAFLEAARASLAPGEGDLFLSLSEETPNLAALVLRPREGSAGFLEREERLARAVSRHLVIALDKSRLFELAIRDGLTGLSIRRHFMARLQEELERSRRYGSPFCVLMIDIDHFKKVNDTWGHPAGDQVLREMAARVQRALRTTDLLGRYGGEEFVALLIKLDREGGLAAAERARATVAGAPFELDHGEALDLTISIGLAAYPADGESPQALVAKADEALYEAKDSGRNQVR